MLFQDYWFGHDKPDVKFTDDLREELKNLEKGWKKCKAYIGSSVRSPSADDQKVFTACLKITKKALVVA